MVSGIDENGNVYVLLESGVEHLVEPTSWRNYKYKYNEKEKRNRGRDCRYVRTIADSFGFGRSRCIRVKLDF